MLDTVLVVKNLTKIYNRREQIGVHDVSFCVQKASFHALIGQNGAGKTTIIKSIIGAYTNWKGEIYLDSVNNKLAQAKNHVGYVPEKALFPTNLTTWQYLIGLGQLSNIPKKMLIERIDYYLDLMHISDLKHKKPHRFSSGQKKKILLIQALIHQPKILILDEPAANLDFSARYELFNLLTTLQKQGMSILISSHILHEIDPYVDSLTLVHQGKVVYSGVKYRSLEQIYEKQILSKR